MKVEDVVATLKKLGKPQTAAIYKRHGSGENVFGVLTSDLVKLQKKIKIDNALAKELWETGFADARILSLLVADSSRLTRGEADRFLKHGQAHFLGCYLCPLVARSPVARETMSAWMKSPHEFTREMGYGIFCVLLKDDPDSVSDVYAEQLLATIEAEIASSANWARYAMNSAVISIGINKPALREKAVAAVRRIGKVEVDHGETTCKTPDAVRYIEKASRRGVGV